MTEQRTSEDHSVAQEGVELLDELIAKCYHTMRDKVKNDAKLGDFLKMLELRRKLAPENMEKKELWNLLRRIRSESMKNHPLTNPKSIPQQSQKEEAR